MHAKPNFHKNSYGVISSPNSGQEKDSKLDFPHTRGPCMLPPNLIGTGPRALYRWLLASHAAAAKDPDLQAIHTRFRYSLAWSKKREKPIQSCGSDWRIGVSQWGCCQGINRAYHLSSVSGGSHPPFGSAWVKLGFHLEKFSRVISDFDALLSVHSSFWYHTPLDLAKC